MATVLTASLLLGVARRFLSLGALGAGDLKAGLSWVLFGFGVSISLRFGGGSKGCDSTDSTGRFRAGGGGGFGRDDRDARDARGASSSESDS